MERILKFSLDDKARFHIGDGTVGLKEIFSSDQFFSAIINNLAALYPDSMNEEIDLFIKENRMSSMFYGLEIEDRKGSVLKEIFFFPKPQSPLINYKQDGQKRKILKKIKYISTRTMKELLKTWNTDTESFNIDKLNTVIFSKRFLLLKEEIKELNIEKNRLSNLNFIRYNDKPGITIDRMTDKSDDFYFQKYLEIRYQPIGNYLIKPFMYSILKGKLSNKILASIRLLADEGIGGERSRGLGLFSGFTIKENNSIYFSLNRNPKYYLNLSTVFPDIGEVKGLVCYELEKKSGYIYSNGGVPYRKKTVRVIKEGSIFNQEIKGDMIDLAPEKFSKHPVYLFGKALLIGFGGDN